MNFAAAASLSLLHSEAHIQEMCQVERGHVRREGGKQVLVLEYISLFLFALLQLVFSTYGIIEKRYTPSPSSPILVALNVSPPNRRPFGWSIPLWAWCLEYIERLRSALACNCCRACFSKVYVSPTSRCCLCISLSSHLLCLTAVHVFCPPGFQRT